MIAVVDYGVGNLFSLCSSLRQLGLETAVTADPAVIRAADRVILPGVGAFGDAMEKLAAAGLVPVIRAEAEKKPLLGICLGMQLLFDKSWEFGEHAGLGLVPGQVCPRPGPQGAADRLERFAHPAGRPPLPLHPGRGVCLLRPQLLRQRLRRKHPRCQRLLHPGHRGGAGGPGLRHPVPSRKERGHRAADLESLCRTVRALSVS